MKVTALSEARIRDIGHAFGYYDYGAEHGLIDAFADREAAAAFICGYVRMALQSGMLYTTGERGEGYIAFRRPGERVGIRAGLHLARGLLGVEAPVFIGASDGGMVAQIYVQKYPGETGGLILISTGGMDANTLRSLRRKYFLAPVMLWYMKHCNYEKLKPGLIKAGMRHIRGESREETAYAQDMFETIFKDYTQEKDVHISGLLADLMNQRPVTADDFAALAGKILLILPDQDFFSGKMQTDLIRLMHGPEIAYVSGEHLSTVLKTDAYIRTIRAFLEKPCV